MNLIARMTGMAASVALLTGCFHDTRPTQAPAVRVKAECVTESSVGSSKKYSGTAEASTSTALSFAAAGTIKQMNVSVGDRVAPGQLIGELDGASLRSAYDIAAATLAEARDAHARMKQLHEANALPDMKWVEIQNTLKQAEAAEAIAKKALSDTRLYAVRGGYVAEKMADAGMNAAPGIPVVRIVDIRPVKVSVSVAENEISGIRPGAQATITVSALGGKTFTGRLTEKGVTANPLSRSYDVKFEVANTEGDLLPGMVCDVAIATDSTRRAMVLPVSAVLIDADNRNFVWLDSAGVAVKRVVTVEGVTDGGIAVSAGIAPGDSVITVGQQKVSRGTKVVNINK